MLYLRRCRCVHNTIIYCFNCVFYNFIIIIYLFFEGEGITYFLWALYDHYFIYFVNWNGEISIILMRSLFQRFFWKFEKTQTRVVIRMKIRLRANYLFMILCRMLFVWKFLLSIMIIKLTHFTTIFF